MLDLEPGGWLAGFLVLEGHPQRHCPSRLLEASSSRGLVLAVSWPPAPNNHEAVINLSIEPGNRLQLSLDSFVKRFLKIHSSVVCVRDSSALTG